MMMVDIQAKDALPTQTTVALVVSRPFPRLAHLVPVRVVVPKVVIKWLGGLGMWSYEQQKAGAPSLLLSLLRQIAQEKKPSGFQSLYAPTTPQLQRLGLKL